ncbi:MAG TPA: TetR/AcrR family transcriptional regulator [Acidimicrobiales bacterium]|nr:TetR/AcrR family transcriptional regulator [Acidimicrobiales bacterium]
MAGTEGGPPGSQAWWAAHEERLARRRPRQDGLTLERILLEALDLVDSEGLDALTVRGLAARFDTSSATLYRHVDSRDELLVLLVDHVLGEIRLPDPGLPGRRRVEALSREFRQVLLRHRNVIPAMNVAPMLGPNAVHAADSGLANLLDAGFPGEVAVPAYLALIDYVLGSVFFDSAGLPGREIEGLGPGRVDATGSPALQAHQEALAASRSDEVFAFGLATFLAGLEATTDASGDR